MEIEVRPIESTDKHAAFFGSDLSTDEKWWANTSVAAYFGLKSIKSNGEAMETLWPEKQKRIRQLIIPPWKIINMLREPGK